MAEHFPPDPKTLATESGSLPGAPAEHGAPGPVTRRTLRCRTVAEKGLRQMNHIRDVPPFALEERLGPAPGSEFPTPTEILLAAVGACLSAGIQADAAAHSVTVRSLQVDVEADYDPAALMSIAGGDPRPVGLDAVRVVVHLDADAPQPALRKLVDRAVIWSPVGNIVHDPVHLDVTFA